MAAVTNGGIVSTAYRIARYVVPHTTKMTKNASASASLSAVVEEATGGPGFDKAGAMAHSQRTFKRNDECRGGVVADDIRLTLSHDQHPGVAAA